jgi:hypothetical protein
MIPHSKAATLAVALGLRLWVQDVAAETLSFPEHNFSIELMF